MPLADDPFFQFVKGNKTAREMLLKPGELFTPETVIEKALRQEIGPDPTMATNKENFQMDTKHTHPMGPVWEYKKKYREKTPMLNEQAYFYDYKLIERRQKVMEESKEKPATFLNRPLTRGQIRRKFMRRNLKRKDFDYRNTALLSKFLNEAGKLYNRYQSRLMTPVQRKVARTIKRARHMGLLPTVGIVKPTDKISLGTFMEDIEEMHKKQVDPLTGRMFLKHSL